MSGVGSFSAEELRAIDNRVTSTDALWSEWLSYVEVDRVPPRLEVRAVYAVERPAEVPRTRYFSRHEQTGEWEDHTPKSTQRSESGDGPA